MSDDIPREQIGTALRFLEWSHGDALQRPWSDEVHAYYQAIKIIEDALDENLLPPDEVDELDSDHELIKQSRQAREQGYAEATLLKERHGSSTHRTHGLLERITRFFASPKRAVDKEEA